MSTEPAVVPPLARLPEEWAEATKALGGRPFHGKQIFRWIHARGVRDPKAMTDLPGPMRERMTELDLGSVLTLAHEHRSVDDTRKLVVTMKDGATVETVLIPGVTGPSKREPGRVATALGDADAAAAVEDEDEEATEGPQRIRVTQCISTQVGCAMGCVFCASGVAGLKRQMGPDEIIAQIIEGRNRLDEGEELRNIVFMGMGEPLHNYASTARTLRLLTHPDGISLSPRRITVSTSGLIPEIEKLGKDFNGNVGLAISLHASDDETRSRLMPINKKYPLPKLMDALRAYPLPKRRRITIEYTLVSGKNDTVDEARKLARLLRGLPVKINLIPMNPIEAATLGPPDMGRVLEFQNVLLDAGYSCFVRRRRGDDVAAACGQLALSGEKRRVRVLRD